MDKSHFSFIKYWFKDRKWTKWDAYDCGCMVLFYTVVGICCGGTVILAALG